MIRNTSHLSNARLDALVRHTHARWVARDSDVFRSLACVTEVRFDSGRTRDARTAIPARTRGLVFLLCRYACINCSSSDRLEVDHIIPRALGGSDEIGNLQILCKPCNLRKGASYGIDGVLV